MYAQHELINRRSAMHNRINYFFVIAFIFLAIQAMGCGQTEYTGFIKDKYQACQKSDGIEYHPEEDQCYCSNGIVCQNGYVCDTDINSCMQYISNITKDECEGEFSY